MSPEARFGMKINAGELCASPVSQSRPTRLEQFGGQGNDRSEGGSRPKNGCRGLALLLREPEKGARGTRTRTMARFC
jgi:hypothetical protein